MRFGLLRFRRRISTVRGFNEWCQKVTRPDPNAAAPRVSLGEISKNNGIDTLEKVKVFLDELQRTLNAEQYVLSIDTSGLASEHRDPIEIASSKEDQSIGYIDVSGHDNRIILRNLTVYRLRISQPIIVEIENCNIYEIIVDNHYRYAHTYSPMMGGTPTRFIDRVRSISIVRSRIREISFRDNSIEDFYVARSYIILVRCPAPYEENPFHGSVVFHKVKFGTKRNLGSDEQGYRNVRHHLLLLGNELAAGVDHSAEARLERQNYDFAGWTFSFAYSILSGHGSSIVRPIISLIAIFVVSCLFLLASGTCLLANGSIYVGWKSALGGASCDNSFLWALVWSAQTTFNPLGVFRGHSYLVAENMLVSAWLVVHSLLSAVLIALLILALRRRFKKR